jgi:hypothetical protein
MVVDRAPEPGVIDRVEIEPPDPEPADCLPPGESPITSSDLSPGWIAVTNRELLRYHPEQTPALVRTARQNVTGIAVRRAGGRSFLQYVPKAFAYAIVALVVGSVLLSVSPEQFISVPDAPGAGEIGTIVQLLGTAMGLLGVVLVFTGILAGLAVVTVIGYWLFSRDVTLVIERGSAEPIECPTNQQAGKRAIRELRDVFSGPHTTQSSASTRLETTR